MSTTNQFQATRLGSAKFAECMNTLRTQCRSFAGCVRLEYQAIEDAIGDGVPLESIVAALSESYSLQGSLAALKSALSRIRRARDGQDCQQWLDRNAPVAPQTHGTPDGLTGRHPAMNPHVQSGIGTQPYGSSEGAMQQQFPGAGPITSTGGPFQLPGQHPHWSATGPWNGQVPQWQSPPGHHPYGVYPQSRF